MTKIRSLYVNIYYLFCVICCSFIIISWFIQDNNTETFDSRAPLTKPMNQTQAPPPPWLQDPAATSAAPANGAAATTTDGNGQTIDPVIPRMILYTRLINLVLSVLMILTSMLAMLTTQSATTGVLACYVIVFSCLLCCFETHLKQVSKFIAMNFGFMYSAKSRSFFMLFVGKCWFSFFYFMPHILYVFIWIDCCRYNFIFF